SRWTRWSCCGPQSEGASNDEPEPRPAGRPATRLRAGAAGAEHAAAVAFAALDAAARQAEPLDAARAMALPGHPAATYARRRVDADRKVRAPRARALQPQPGAGHDARDVDDLHRPAAHPARRDRAQ